MNTKENNEDYNIVITGRHVHVTDAMKDYAREKITKIERFSNKYIEVAVTMDIQKLEHRVDIVLTAGNLKIKVHAVSNEMYVSVDKAVERLQTKLRKYKERIHSHQAKPRSVVDMNVNVIRPAKSEIDDINAQIEAETQRRVLGFEHHEIVKKEKRPLKLLTTDEAVMKMDLSEDHFMVFRCEETNKLRVIYRRDDEDYGIIEIE